MIDEWGWENEASLGMYHRLCADAPLRFSWAAESIIRLLPLTAIGKAVMISVLLLYRPGTIVAEESSEDPGIAISDGTRITISRT
jgi:hypothetical protein